MLAWASMRGRRGKKRSCSEDKVVMDSLPGPSPCRGRSGSDTRPPRHRAVGGIDARASVDRHLIMPQIGRNFRQGEDAEVFAGAKDGMVGNAGGRRRLC